MVPDEKVQEIIDQIPEEVRHLYGLDNEGNVVRRNRAFRRRKPPTDNWYTKNTNAIRKKREHAKAKRHRRSS